jgi:Spy/CpxP family protein refolding chaperone
MAEQLELNDEQKQKVYQLHLKNAQKRQAEWEATKSEMEARREAMQQQRKQQTEEIEAILSPEQKEKWAEIRESNRTRGEMMHQRRGGEKGNEYKRPHRGSFQGKDARQSYSRRTERHSRS